FLKRHVHHARVDDRGRVVDEDIELAEAFDGQRNHRTGGHFAGYVPDKRDDAVVPLKTSFTAALMSSATTKAPRACNSSTVARPMPLAAPVTMATFSCTSLITLLFIAFLFG